MFNLQLLAFISILETVFTMTADLEITSKRRPVENVWKKERDSFKISSSLCSKNFVSKTFNAEETIMAMAVPVHAPNYMNLVKTSI